MEIQVNDLVEVQYNGHLLVGQVYRIYHGMGQYDVMLPELGVKRFPSNCITRRIAREEEVSDQESSEQADATGDNGADIVGLLTSFNNDLPTSQSELPSTDGPATEPEPDFGGGGGFSGGGGGDSWGGSYGESDSSSDTGSSDSGFGGSEGAE